MARLAAIIGIAAEGMTYAGVLALVGLFSLLIGWWWLGAPLLVLALAVGAFFRDPERSPPVGDSLVVSAADGRVCDIGEAAMPETNGAMAHRVSVFMSPLDVHINRAPISGKVAAVRHTAGDFRAAFRDEASEHNERNAIIFLDGERRRHAIVQIAGYLARRIICRLRPSDTVRQGDRLGLIMFGSRVDHFLPLNFRVEVSVGDRVRGGETILGSLDDA